MLPRLTRLWTHLERQRGGVGMRGPGETQLETDKRIILDKISKLKRDLVEIDKQKKRAAEEPRKDGPRGTGRLYQCRKVYIDEPA